MVLAVLDHEVVSIFLLFVFVVLLQLAVEEASARMRASLVHYVFFLQGSAVRAKLQEPEGGKCSGPLDSTITQHNYCFLDSFRAEPTSE